MSTNPSPFQSKLSGRFDAGKQEIIIDATLTDKITQTLMLLNAPSLAFTQASLTPTDGASLAQGESYVSGKTVLWDIQDVSLTITFQGEGAAQQVSIQASLPSLTFPTISQYIVLMDSQQVAALSHVSFDQADVRVAPGSNELDITARTSQWGNFLGIGNVGLSNLELKLKVLVGTDDWQRDSQAELTGTLNLPSAAIPIAIDLPVGIQRWQVRMLPPGIALASLADLGELLVGTSVVADLPAEVGQMTALTLTALEIQFDPQKPGLNNIFFSITTTDPWSCAENVTITTLAVSATIHLTADGTFALYGFISGNIKVGRFDLFVSIPFPFSGPATLRMATNQPIDALSDLAALIGSVDLAGTLPADLPTGELILRNLMLTLDLGTKRVTSLGVDLALAQEWSIFSDALSVEGIEIRLNAIWMTDSWMITGQVNGSIGVEGIWVAIIAERLVDRWSLRLGDSLTLPGIASLGHLIGGNDLDNFLPAGMSNTIGELTIDSFEMDFDPATHKLSAVALAISAANEWTFVPGYLTLQSLLLALTVTQPTDSTQRRLTGQISGGVMLGDTGIWLNAQKGDASAPWVFSGNLESGSTINLSRIISALLPEGTTLPSEVPDVILSALAIVVTPDTGAFTLSGQSIITWELPFGVSGLSVSSVDLALQRSAATGNAQTGAQISCSLKLHSQGPVTIVDGLVFNSMDLSFDLDQQAQSWALSGSVSASVLEVGVTLAASVLETAALRTITLNASEVPTGSLLTLGDVGSLGAASVILVISKALQPATTNTGISLGTSSPYTWSLQITSSLVLTDVFTLNGSLALAETANTVSLAFTPTVAQAVVSLPEPLQDGKTYLGIEALSLVGTTDSQGKRTWSFDTGIDVWFSDLPASVQSYMPSATKKVRGRFHADSSQVQVTVDQVLPSESFTLPTTHVGSKTLDLGDVEIELSHLAFTLGSAMALSVNAGFGLPEKLNALFGTDKDGTPVHQWFNSYQPGNEASVTKIQVRLDRTNGLLTQLITSPLKATTFSSEGQSSWCTFDLGGFGAVKFLVPTFGYSNGNFHGTGALTQIRPLKIPLTPLKWLLNACGLSAAADKIPDSIPLQELKIYDEATQHFDTDALIQLIEDVGISLDADVQQALHGLESQLDKLPDRFKSYLDIEIPQSLSFDFSATTTGSVRGGITLDKATPIKILFPAMGLLGPQINGIELYGFSIGEMLDGALLLLNLDMVIDQFNLLTLIAALALPLDTLHILPRTQDLLTTITLHNLFMLIIYETVIPIPIPLFYDELGLDYLGLEGLALQTHWKFPKPHPGSADASRLFKDFEQFFTDHNPLLDTAHPPQGMDLVLTIGPNFLQLPPYLGGATLGSKEKTIVVSAYENLAHLLNALKTLSLNELVQAIPLADRVGKDQIAFSCMSLEIDWLITTSQEFRAVSYQQFQLAGSGIDGILQVVPPSPSTQEQGLIILLRGSWQASQLISLDVLFGLIGTGAGFGTGLSVQGSLSDFLALELQGVVVIEPGAASAFSLNGHSSLSIANSQVFVGDLQIDDQHFYLQGQLILFPPASPLQIGGSAQFQIDKSGQIYLHTAITVALSGFVLLNSVITVTNTSLQISGTWLGCTSTIQIIVQNNDFIFSGSFVFQPSITIHTGAIADKTTGLTIVDHLDFSAAANASFGVTLGNHGFAADVAASFTWNSSSWNLPSFHLFISPQSIEDVANLLAQQIEQEASTLFTTIFSTMADWFKAGVAGLVQVSAQWSSAVQAARHWGATAWSAVEQWPTSAWQAASHWDTNAWNATTKWGDSAWNATKSWGDSAWSATDKWGQDTWNQTTQWSDGVWNKTTTWTTAQWNDFDNTLANLKQIMHADTAATLHIDIPATHIDTSSRAHIDVATIHADSAPAGHIDIPLIHADTPAAHADVATIHADSAPLGHFDVATIHADTPAAHADVKAIHADSAPAGHIDVATIHADTPATHADVSAIHSDRQMWPHGDSHTDGHLGIIHSDIHNDIPQNHSDTVTSPHTDAQTVPHIDGITSPHSDRPAVAHIDGITSPHTDAQTVPHIDGITSQHSDKPAVAHIDVVTSPHTDARAVPHIDVSTPHGDTAPSPHIDAF